MSIGAMSRMGRRDGLSVLYSITVLLHSPVCLCGCKGKGFQTLAFFKAQQQHATTTLTQRSHKSQTFVCQVRRQVLKKQRKPLRCFFCALAKKVVFAKNIWCGKKQARCDVTERIDVASNAHNAHRKVEGCEKRAIYIYS